MLKWALNTCRAGPSRRPAARSPPGGESLAVVDQHGAVARQLVAVDMREGSHSAGAVDRLGAVQIGLAAPRPARRSAARAPARRSPRATLASSVMRARPLMRSTSAMPGTRNSMPMWPVSKMFSIELKRLLPMRSGSSRCRSSSTRTKPAGSPRGETSAPFDPCVPITTKVDARDHGAAMLVETAEHLAGRARQRGRMPRAHVRRSTPDS